jgi:predicted SprT family Zn-dependent metalloprotease
LTNHEFMQAAEKKMAWCWATLMQRYNKVLPSPKLTFALRGRCAGMHHGATGEIELNMDYVAKNGQDMIDQTVPHEVVHAWLTLIGDPSHVRSSASMQQYAIDRARGFRVRRPKRNPHGETFMRTLASLGGKTLRCHNYDTSEIVTATRKQNRWAWKCPACGAIFQLSTCRHNKAMRGAGYFHPKCGRVGGTLVRVY